MNMQDPATNCFITTSKDHPIHLWDVSSGSMRCSYSGYDHMDELESAICVSFNLSGSRIYAGSNRMIRCFDVSQPGRNYTSIPTCRTRRSVDGQRGLISCLSFNPDMSGTFAAGSYSCSVSVYVEDMQGAALELTQLGFAVTHMKWSPCGRYLWAGGRSCGDICCWDLRHTREMVGKVHRDLTSNQRVMFDLDPWGRYLATGTQKGDVLFFDTTTFELVHTLHGPCSKINESEGEKEFQEETDTIGQAPRCMNTVQFHPYCGLLMGIKGERVFAPCLDDDDDGGGGGDDDVSGKKRKRSKGGEISSDIYLWSLDKEQLHYPITTEIITAD
mmetsp:Transcript_7978/g.11919  ORF Transcript_7978/g.11919 Transcript_7978/m.11919 type:complete len:330 (-) Transcript_7978:106-1095(-)